MKRVLWLTLAVLSSAAHAYDIDESKGVTTFGKPRAYTTAEVYDVQCTPKQPRCMLGGKEVSRQEMRETIPKATWGYCRREFCYGDTRMKAVIGLNPEYFMYPIVRSKPNNAITAVATPALLEAPQQQ